MVNQDDDLIYALYLASLGFWKRLSRQPALSSEGVFVAQGDLPEARMLQVPVATEVEPRSLNSVSAQESLGVALEVSLIVLTAVPLLSPPSSSIAVKPFKELVQTTPAQKSLLFSEVVSIPLAAALSIFLFGALTAGWGWIALAGACLMAYSGVTPSSALGALTASRRAYNHRLYREKGLLDARLDDLKRLSIASQPGLHECLSDYVKHLMGSYRRYSSTSRTGFFQSQESRHLLKVLQSQFYTDQEKIDEVIGYFKGDNQGKAMFTAIALTPVQLPAIVHSVVPQA